MFIMNTMQTKSNKREYHKHGLIGTRIYRIWANIKVRCFNKNKNEYKYYGGRGITVCKEWKNNFQAFYDWAMANGYRDDLTIDRINNDGNYEPSNCRWITKKEQCNNKRNNRVCEVNGKTYTVAELAIIYNINRSTLVAKLNKGIDIKKILDIF